MKNVAKIMVVTFIAGILTVTTASAYSFGSPVEGQATLGNYYQRIVQGSVVTGTLPETSGTWKVAGNSNPVSAMVFIDGSTLNIWGVRPGVASVKTCAHANECVTVSVAVYTPAADNGNVLGANTYPDGQLISQNQTIYLVYKNTKTGFASYEAFTGLGYDIKNVVASTASLPDTGYLVTTSEASHPWGSWIRDNGTVYYIHELGLVPVSSLEIFTSNGGNAASVVTANAFDMQRPTLPLMTMNDSRVK